MIKTNYATIKLYDIANGPGVRASLFVSGCPHRCKGCFNPEAWDFKYGKLFGIAEHVKILEHLGKPYITGLSLLGGEPMAHVKDLLPLVQGFKKLYPSKSIWLYTGYTYEYIADSDILKYVDVVVDGRFIEAEKDLNLRFRGSANQRIIDVQESRRLGETVLMKEYYEEAE